MPLVSSALAAQIVSAGGLNGLSGTQFTTMADVIAKGVSTALLLPDLMSAQMTGVSGVGQVSSVTPPIGILSPAMGASIADNLKGTGMSGLSIPKLSLAVATGFCLSSTQIKAVGVARTVSTGAGVAKFVNLQPSSMYSLLMTAASSKGMVGTEVSRFMYGLSNGICSYLVVAFTIPVMASGPPIPPPPAGPAPSAGPAIIQLV